jgi:hypothetical protein
MQGNWTRLRLLSNTVRVTPSQITYHFQTALITMRMTVGDLNLLANVTVADFLSRCFKVMKMLGKLKIIPSKNKTTVVDYSRYGANEF